jgi:hypothetical protein
VPNTITFAIGGVCGGIDREEVAVTELETAPAQINSANTTLHRSGAAAYLASHAGVHGLELAAGNHPGLQVMCTRDQELLT